MPFYKGSKAHDQDDRIIYGSTKGALFYDPDGNGAAPQTQFAKIGKKLAVTTSDFLVF
jgi:serralysin